MKAKSRRLTRQTIREDYIHSRPASVDSEQGIIKGVKILGLISENGRRYTRQALEKAQALYEGRLVNVDHPDRPHDQRSAYDRIGKLQNVSLREDGLYGDLILLRTHELSKRVLEAAERMPEAFGLSHNADGQGYRDQDGIYVIEEITLVRSVDLVADAATNKSLFESRNMKKTLRQAIQEAKHVKPALKKKLLEFGGRTCEAGEEDDLLNAEMPSEPEGDWKSDLVAAIGKLVASEDEADHAMAKKIMAMLKPASGALNEEGEPEEDEDGKPSEEARDSEGHGWNSNSERKAAAARMSEDDDWNGGESKTPQRGKGRAITEAKAKRLCKLAGITEDKHLVTILAKLPDEESALDHLDYVKGLTGKKIGSPPRSSSPGNPVTEGKAPKDYDGFKRLILN